MATTIPIEELKRLSNLCATGSDPFIHGLPKVELHTHIEGCVTPALRWRFAQRNGRPAESKSRGLKFNSLTELERAYEPTGAVEDAATGQPPLISFFELFDEGVQVLQTEQDFYELAMDFFSRCAEENVRHVEMFFGPHSHRHRGIAPQTFMDAYSRAQREAAERLGISSGWIMVLNRAKPLEEAWENYRTVALPYRHMIVGVGLACNEIGHPPHQFDEIFRQARSDGFKITVHCDPDMPETHENIHEVLTSVADTGADRCDHGINAAENPDLILVAKEKSICLTLCPWTYATYHSDHPVWKSIRILYDAGVQITLNSDDPPYMMGQYTEGNLMLAKMAGGFTNAEILQMQKIAVERSWAPDVVKERLRNEVRAYETRLDASLDDSK